MSAFAGRLLDARSARDFALAGNARFTIVSTKTGARFTYRVRVNGGAPKEGDPPPKGPWFVSVLTGADNDGDFTYLGTMFLDGAYRHGRKSRIGQDAPSAQAFAWFWRQVQAGTLPATVEAWHEGRCGRCGRALTVPESIASGLGPVCAGLMSVAA